MSTSKIAIVDDKAGPKVCGILHHSARLRYHCLVVRALSLLLAFLWSGSVAHAQDEPDSYIRIREAREPHALGDYQGVVPGEANRPPRARAIGSRRVVTWPGFQLRADGASRFFIQTNQEVAPELLTEANRVTVRLRGTGVHLWNNRRWLETQFFNTPVARARIERRRRDVFLVLELRANVIPRVSSERAPTGFYFVYVEFPPGNYVPAELRAAPSPDSGALQPIEEMSPEYDDEDDSEEEEDDE
jgi:hypothetical protein